MKEVIGNRGVMNLANYQTCKTLEEDSIPHWLNYFRQKPSVWRAYFIDDVDLQKQDHCDIYVVFRGEKQPIRIDVKTRSFGYYELYKKDQRILIEVQGNTSGKQGSSVFNSNAEYWGYSWFDGNKLYEPIIFNRKRFVEWFKFTKNKFEQPRNSNTDGLYETENRLVDRIFFTPFEDLVL